MRKMEHAMYFAYGSNMNLDQMAYRCPAAEAVCTAKLEGYELFFAGRPGNGVASIRPKQGGVVVGVLWKLTEACEKSLDCALPGFVDSKNEEKTERNAGYLVVSHSGGGMLRQGTRKGIRRTPANRGMRAHWVVKGLDISEDVCHGMCP